MEIMSGVRGRCVLVFSDSFEQHLERLEATLDRFRRAGLKLKPKKCFLA